MSFLLSLYDCIFYIVLFFFLTSVCFFFFKQKTAYEMRISDWSSDVCSSDLRAVDAVFQRTELGDLFERRVFGEADDVEQDRGARCRGRHGIATHQVFDHQRIDLAAAGADGEGDRKSTRLNSSH